MGFFYPSLILDEVEKQLIGVDIEENSKTVKKYISHSLVSSQKMDGYYTSANLIV